MSIILHVRVALQSKYSIVVGAKPFLANQNANTGVSIVLSKYCITFSGSVWLIKHRDNDHLVPRRFIWQAREGSNTNIAEFDCGSPRATSPADTLRNNDVVITWKQYTYITPCVQWIYSHGLTLISTWISNHVYYKVWDENGVAV